MVDQGSIHIVPHTVVNRMVPKLHEMYSLYFFREFSTFDAFREKVHTLLDAIVCTAVALLVVVVLTQLVTGGTLVIYIVAPLGAVLTYIALKLLSYFTKYRGYLIRCENEAVYAALLASVYLKVARDHEARFILNNVIEKLAEKDLVLPNASRFFKCMHRDGGVKALDKYIALVREKRLTILESILITFRDIVRTGEYLLYSDRLRDRAFEAFRAKLTEVMRVHEQITMAIASVILLVPCVLLVMIMLLYSETLLNAFLIFTVIYALTAIPLLMYIDRYTLIKRFDYSYYYVQAGVRTVIVAVPAMVTVYLVHRYLDNYIVTAAAMYVASIATLLTFHIVFRKYDRVLDDIFVGFVNVLNQVAQQLEIRGTNIYQALMNVVQQSRDNSPVTKFLDRFNRLLVAQRFRLNKVISYLSELRGTFSEFLKVVISTLADIFTLGVSATTVRDLARAYDEYIAMCSYYISSMSAMKYVLYCMVIVGSATIYLIIYYLIKQIPAIPQISASAPIPTPRLMINLPTPDKLPNIVMLTTAVIIVLTVVASIIVSKVTYMRIGDFAKLASISLTLALAVFLFMTFMFVGW